MDNDNVRALYASLISRPALTDQLLARPPFKFLLDVIANTIAATGFLKDRFSAVDLDAGKLAEKSAKTAFLDALIAALNDDGALEDVKSAKIIAGKEPEKTLLLLQRFGERAASSANSAAAANGRDSRKSEKSDGKERSKSRDKKKESPSTDDKVKKHRDKDEKKEKKTKDGAEKKEKKDKDKEKESRASSKERKTTKEKNDVKSSKDVKDKKVKSSSSSDKEKKEKKESKERKDKKETKEKKEKEKEKDAASSSSKSRRDSKTGIAIPSAAVVSSKRRPSNVESLRLDDVDDDDDVMEKQHHFSNGFHPEPVVGDEPKASVAQVESPRPPPPEERAAAFRPQTGAARPQTSMGRPGTAAARPAPPKLRRKQLEVVEQQQQRGAAPEVVERKADIIVESSASTAATADVDDFIEEIDEFAGDAAGTGLENALNEAALLEGGERGGLVAKIIETRAEIEEGATAAEAAATAASDDVADDGELARQKQQVSQLQDVLQKVTQTAFPLSRLFDFAQEDFEAMVKEMEKWRAEARKNEQAVADAKANDHVSEQKDHSLLKQLGDEIRTTRSALMTTRAKIIENEDNIRAIISNM